MSVYYETLATWTYHHSQLTRAKVFGHTYDTAIDVGNGFKFGLDIPTSYPISLERLDAEVKAAIFTLQSVEDKRMQVTPASRRSLGNYGQPRPYASLGCYFPL